MSTEAPLERADVGSCESGGILGLPSCCPLCHGRGLVTLVVVGAENFYLCCALLAELIRRCPDAVVVDDETWTIPNHSLGEGVVMSLDVAPPT